MLPAWGPHFENHRPRGRTGKGRVPYNFGRWGHQKNFFERYNNQTNPRITTPDLKESVHCSPLPSKQAVLPKTAANNQVVWRHPEKAT